MTRASQPHKRPGSGKYWVCALGFNCTQCSVFSMCQSLPPCATHTSPPAPDACSPNCDLFGECSPSDKRACRKDNADTSPPAPECTTIGKPIKNQGITVFSSWTALQEHDAQVAKAEREKVLKKMVNILAAHTINSDDFAKDGIKSGWILVGGYEPIIDDIESLSGSRSHSSKE